MKNLSIVKTAFLIFNILLCLNLFSQDSYVVNVESLNVRELPNISAKILTKLKQGDVIGTIDTTNNQWWQINYYGNVGYVSPKYLVSANSSNEYKSYEKLQVSTGDNYDCENIISEYDRQYDNEFRIKMGYGTDGVVKLMNMEHICIRIAYIKGGDTYTMRNIPLGDYTLRIAYGRDLRRSVEGDKCIVRFLQDPIYKEGTQKFTFEKIYDTQRSNKSKGDIYYNLSGYALDLNVSDSYKDLNKHSLVTDKISEKKFNQ